MKRMRPRRLRKAHLQRVQIGRQVGEVHYRLAAEVAALPEEEEEERRRAEVVRIPVSSNEKKARAQVSCQML